MIQMILLVQFWTVHEHFEADHYLHRCIFADCRNHSYPGILEDRTMNAVLNNCIRSNKTNRNKNWSLGHNDLHTEVYSRCYSFFNVCSLESETVVDVALFSYHIHITKNKERLQIRFGILFIN